MELKFVLCEAADQRVGRLAVVEMNLHSRNHCRDSTVKMVSVKGSSKVLLKSKTVTHIIGFKYRIASSSMRLCNSPFVFDAASRARLAAVCRQCGCAPAGRELDRLKA